MKKSNSIQDVSLYPASDSPVSQVSEVAIYRVNNPITYPALLKETMKGVITMPGFVRGIHLQSPTDPYLFADINFWEDLETAEAAAHRVHTEPTFTTFMDSFNELKVFGHFLADSPPAELNRFMRPSAAIELAVYSVKDAEIQKQYRPGVYRFLRDHPSFFGGIALSSLKSNESHIDFIAWTTQQEAEKTAASMMTSHEHMAFFQNTDEVKLFEFFNVYDQNGRLNDA
ncbi:hypothetical protein [Photobacterium sp. OFAV2-7]|uniref:hypothetical protein n=1 Tax=Photobacterium sp. OFAV2-7 TaxID=2917748 RepID=UPI001EF5AC2E|nr:hypothetical protein [Photobacterium sp. OFAV2-7]MCG7585754.1 hypothetical protein [Photobacterium sp. OFAV2-7]